MVQDRGRIEFPISTGSEKLCMPPANANLIFLKLQLLTQQRKNKILNIELVTPGKTFYFST